eukprot:274199-Pleurochrysis_carterae.AAC.1
MAASASARPPSRSRRLRCGAVFVAAGVKESQRYFGEASITADRLRRTAKEQPSPCASWCIQLFVDASVASTLRIQKDWPLMWPWDKILTYPEVPPVTSARSERSGGRASSGYQGAEVIWIQRISALIASTDDILMFLDSDTMPCPNWNQLINWFVASGLDVASATPAARFSGSFGNPHSPTPLGIAEGEKENWARFSERNLGFGLLRRSRPIVKDVLLQFQSEFIRMANDTSLKINADQSAWRAALWWGLHNGSKHGLLK